MITMITVWLFLITHVACDVLITVNNNGSGNGTCCVNGTCPCSSLSSALHNVSDNTVINITSESVTLHDIVGMGSGNLRHIIITGNGATIMCNNTGGVYCKSCSNITIMGITWYQCGRNDSEHPITQIPVLNFTNILSKILIHACTFQNSSGCPVYMQGAKGNISVIESSFVGTVLDIVRGSDPYYYYAAIAGLYISSNAKMVLAIKDSRFDSNGCTWNDGSDDCNHYTSIYAAVIESNMFMNIINFYVKTQIFPIIKMACCYMVKLKMQ